MFISPPIDYRNIATAIDFYVSRGYRYIEVPWIVPSTDATRPIDRRPFSTFAGELVGSGEQGFWWMEGLKGRYVTCTPCFRDEQSMYFMKVELFSTVGGDWLYMLNDAVDLFRSLGAPVEIVVTSEGRDIYVNGVECGSYGTRGPFAYGTGLAEPRFSISVHRNIYIT